MVGLKIYKFKDKESYENLKPMLNGWCFFRTENDIHYVKAPTNKTITDLVGMSILIEVI
jgi:hypothetical protein